MAFALLCIVIVALVHRQGALDGLNEGLMMGAGRLRDSGGGQHFTTIMQFASTVGGTGGRLLLLGGALALLLWSGRRRAAVWLAATMAGGTLLNLLLKQIFSAPRPDLLPHLDIVHSYSFPSGHAAGNMMFFGALAMLAGRWPAYAAAGAVIALIGVSRVWLGVHWPSDVLAGWIEGIGWLALCACWMPRASQQRAGRGR